MKTKLIILIFFIFSIECIAYQNNKKRLLQIYNSHFNQNKQISTYTKYYHINDNAYSEFSILSTIFMKFYKKYISSQDITICNYTISCSNFSLIAINKYGFLKGIFITGDRLLRCNTLSKRYYPIDSKTKLAIDYPIEFYNIFYKKNSQCLD